jgi:hypothetical protein
MKRLNKFIEKTYPHHDLINGGTVYLITQSEDYVSIASVTKEGFITLIDKYIYQSQKGPFIRALISQNRHVRIYLDNVKEATSLVMDKIDPSGKDRRAESAILTDQEIIDAENFKLDKDKQGKA